MVKKLKNPTLLTLLKQGAKVEFESGYSLTGSPSQGIIELATPFGADGIRLLNPKGLDESIRDAKKWQAEQEQL